MKSVVAQAIKSILIGVVGEILYFPFWWYSVGLKRIVLYIFNSIRDTARNLAIPLLLKSLFKPMYGQYDRQGRIISFFMRIIITTVKLIAFIFLAILNLVIIVVWIALPVVVVWGLVNNFSTIWKP